MKTLLLVFTGVLLAGSVYAQPLSCGAGEKQTTCTFVSDGEEGNGLQNLPVRQLAICEKQDGTYSLKLDQAIPVKGIRGTSFDLQHIQAEPILVWPNKKEKVALVMAVQVANHDVNNTIEYARLATQSLVDGAPLTNTADFNCK